MKHEAATKSTVRCLKCSGTRFVMGPALKHIQCPACRGGGAFTITTEEEGRIVLTPIPPPELKWKKRRY